MAIDLNYGDDLYKRYTKYCEKIVNNDAQFANFRNHPDYCYMLEHVTKEYGMKYLEDIKFDLNWEQLKSSDKIGNPKIYEYPKIGKISPTTLRYIHTGLNILENLAKPNSTITIVEIGGGYAGQCKILFNLAPLFGVSIKNYTILDLHFPNLIQSKFLEKNGITNVNCTTIGKFSNTERIDLLISNYALSEIHPDYQKEYIPLIEKSKSGYFLWNRSNILPEILNKNPKIVDEYPTTNFNNKLITY